MFCQGGLGNGNPARDATALCILLDCVCCDLPRVILTKIYWISNLPACRNVLSRSKQSPLRILPPQEWLYDTYTPKTKDLFPISRVPRQDLRQRNKTKRKSMAQSHREFERSKEKKPGMQGYYDITIQHKTWKSWKFGKFGNQKSMANETRGEKNDKTQPWKAWAIPDTRRHWELGC
jgi:hypothetical protein